MIVSMPSSVAEIFDFVEPVQLELISEMNRVNAIVMSNNYQIFVSEI